MEIQFENMKSSSDTTVGPIQNFQSSENLFQWFHRPLAPYINNGRANTSLSTTCLKTCVYYYLSKSEYCIKKNLFYIFIYPSNGL